MDGFLKTKYDSSVDKPLHSVSNSILTLFLHGTPNNVEVKIDNGNESTGAFFVREINICEKRKGTLETVKADMFETISIML